MGVVEDERYRTTILFPGLYFLLFVPNKAAALFISSRAYFGGTTSAGQNTLVILQSTRTRLPSGGRESLAEGMSLHSEQRAEIICIW